MSNWGKVNLLPVSQGHSPHTPRIRMGWNGGLLKKEHENGVRASTIPPSLHLRSIYLWLENMDMSLQSQSLSLGVFAAWFPETWSSWSNLPVHSFLRRLMGTSLSSKQSEFLNFHFLYLQALQGQLLQPSNNSSIDTGPYQLDCFGWVHWHCPLSLPSFSPFCLYLGHIWWCLRATHVVSGIEPGSPPCIVTPVPLASYCCI